MARTDPRWAKDTLTESTDAFVYNRRAEPREFLSNGRPYAIPGHAALRVPREAALLARKQGVESIDLSTNEVTQYHFAVRFAPGDVETDDPDFGVPLDKPAPLERVDRTFEPGRVEIRQIGRVGSGAPLAA